MDMSEIKLIKKILAGEKQLFSQVIDRYQRSIYNLAYRMLGNREDALDIAQETFLRTFKSLNSYDQNRPFSPWIHRIATNLCINQLRKKKLKLVPLVISDDGVERERQIADTGPEPAEQAVVRESQNELLKALVGLPEKYRTPLILRHIHHYTYEQIGEVLEIPPGTVKTWIFRGREILKKNFKKNLSYEEGESR